MSSEQWNENCLFYCDSVTQVEIYLAYMTYKDSYT